MKKKIKFKKYVVMLLFLVATVLSFIFMKRVEINYNLSDYLDDSTQTKIALNIIEDEFGMTGNIQVMASNVSTSTAEEIADKLEDIQYVKNVTFDKNNSNYYKDNNALFIVLVDGDDYSQNAKYVSESIKDVLTPYENIEYGGTAIEKQNLQNAITKEMGLIISIALCLAVAILLLTSASWIEPFVLLLSSGIAILINRGTNFFFKEISYITNSISAILQLALSIDYCIVLLHAYKNEKTLEKDNDVAMKTAIKKVINPISASSLTTIAGLLALLFMSFKIGFDIGIVLIKGIVISAITSLTLLPTLILMFDKLMTKTKKKPLTLHGKGFAKLSFKASKIIAPVALIIIILCGFLQTNNKYIFSDTNASNQNITNNFGNNNTVVIVYKNCDDFVEKENKLIDSIKEYQEKNNQTILSDYTAYSNTVEKYYTLEDANKKLELDSKDTKMLFTMYNLYQSPESLKMNFSDFIDFSYYLMTNDDDAKDFIESDTLNTIETIKEVKDILGSSFTANELYDSLSTETFATADISLFKIKQIYGLYYYENLANDKVDFVTMLKFILTIKDNEEISSLIDSETIEKILTLLSGIEQFEMQMNTDVSKENLQALIYQNTGTMLQEEEVNQIYLAYYNSISQEVKDTIPYLNLFNFLIQTGQITNEEIILQINNYNTLESMINNNYSYEEFIPVIKNVAYALSNEMVEINVTNELIQQIYILYFNQLSSFDDKKLSGIEFVNYTLSIKDSNYQIGSSLSQDSINKLQDMQTINKLLEDNNKKTYGEMYDTIIDLKEHLKSNFSATILDKDKISGVYIKNAIYTNADLFAPIKANDLLSFITENMDTNSLLVQKLDDSNKEKIDSAQRDINKANELLIGNNYSRMLLSVDLPNESDESTNFVKFLTNQVKEVFGEDANITGEIVSTYDLQESFAHDNIFITCFTLISIFLIILIVFRSLSLPILLVAIIQGAIFIAMSTQLLGNGMFFMSYIVSTCILMGATIDYGILMSSNYVIYRQSSDKYQALLKAIETAMPTIFTSGLILTICGFVIHFVSSQNSISTVGLLLGIGTICSVIMIIIVLPSVLHLCDKFLIKFTFSNKKNK